MIAPVGEIRRIDRHYCNDTLVLETDYETADGAMTLIDCMPPRSQEPRLVRVVVGRRGQVRMRMELIIRFDYGSIVPWVSRIDNGIRAVAGHLMTDGFVARYPTKSHVDGLPPGEGAFLACTFWLADNYALLSRQEDALQVFERLLALRNDVGLLSEEYDPGKQRLLGNFPQAFSHISLINTACNLSRVLGPAADRQRS